MRVSTTTASRTMFRSTRPVRTATRTGGLDIRRTRVSIHAAREDRDFNARYKSQISIVFRSTRPVRTATLAGLGTSGEDVFRSTRPVRTATPEKPAARPRVSVSIHAAREDRDGPFAGDNTPMHKFRSTRPVRTATPNVSINAGWMRCFDPRGP